MTRAAPQIVFFAAVSDQRMFDMLEFYSEDIRAFEALGFRVVQTNSAWTAATSQGELLFAWWWHSALIPILAWRIRGRRVLATGATHLSAHCARSPRDAMRIALSAISMRLADANLAISSAEMLDLRRLRARNVVRFPCAVDGQFFAPGIKSETPSAVIVAQLNPTSIHRKGVLVAMRAAARLADRDGFRLAIVGNATADGERIIQELRVELNATNIDVLGELTRKQKRAVLERSWFYLQPSIYEGFGLAVLEAMACGAVPICSSAGSLPELVGVGGLILPDLTDSGLADCLSSLIMDEGRRGRLQVASREQALKYDSTEHVSNLSRILTALGLSVPT